mmetsp:Transcript_39752/g.64551  ORF Transcript_39752/g.64551 Transcript_39752/m.64551 type:complete len:308 (+) Transcript_39752:5213-6136(+)
MHTGRQINAATVHTRIPHRPLDDNTVLIIRHRAAPLPDGSEGVPLYLQLFELLVHLLLHLIHPGLLVRHRFCAGLGQHLPKRCNSLGRGVQEVGGFGDARQQRLRALLRIQPQVCPAMLGPLHELLQQRDAFRLLPVLRQLTDPFAQAIGQIKQHATLLSLLLERLFLRFQLCRINRIPLLIQHWGLLGLFLFRLRLWLGLGLSLCRSVFHIALALSSFCSSRSLRLTLLLPPHALLFFAPLLLFDGLLLLFGSIFHRLSLAQPLLHQLQLVEPVLFLILHVRPLLFVARRQIDDPLRPVVGHARLF